jgi:hypothetical protein
MANDKDPKFWVMVLKLVAGAVAILTLFGLGLYFTAKYNTYAPDAPPPDESWGIAKDHPVRSKH